MAAVRVVRPVVRSFKGRFIREAAAHVRAGGHAVVWETPTRARLVVPRPDRADPLDLGFWSFLDLGRTRYRVATEGALLGLAFIGVPANCAHIVRRRSERDAGFARSTRTLTLDCLACAACCRDNRVELDDEDLARFDDGARSELGKRPYTRTSDGARVLVLLRSKDCRFLGAGNRCAIYALRPNACRHFPMASEGCLFAREKELDSVDGLRPGE